MGSWSAAPGLQCPCPGLCEAWRGEPLLSLSRAARLWVVRVQMQPHGMRAPARDVRRGGLALSRSVRRPVWETFGQHELGRPPHSKQSSTVTAECQTFLSV